MTVGDRDGGSSLYGQVSRGWILSVCSVLELHISSEREFLLVIMYGYGGDGEDDFVCAFSVLFASQARYLDTRLAFGGRALIWTTCFLPKASFMSCVV